MGLEKRISSIDFLKFLAIFLVILFHVLYQISLDNSLRIIGFIGVSLFFIISGFVLAKKYSFLESFSMKWLFNRYVKIAALYYISLLVIVVLFSTQSYSGDLLKTLGLHFIFLDPLFSTYAYTIISSAWFLTPLIGLYILFPYLNRLIKKSFWFLILIFAVMIVARFYSGNYTSYSPLFFIGEFCFGIAFAYNKKDLALFSSLFVVFIMPTMFLPFLIFYFIAPVENKLFSWKVFSWISANTLALFLFHESFMNLIFGKWHIYNLNIYFSLIIFSVIAIASVFASRYVQGLFVKKPSNIKKEIEIKRKIKH